MRSTISRVYVTRIDDDSESPIIGLVMGWEDDDHCWIAWGDAKYAEDPWDEARLEKADELMPRSRRR